MVQNTDKERLIRAVAAARYLGAVELQGPSFTELRTPPRDIVRCPPVQLFGELAHPDTHAVTLAGPNAARGWGRWEGIDWA
jgi:hypothetical protein